MAANYSGIRPYIQAAARQVGADVLRVEKSEPIKRMNRLLCQVTPYINRGEFKDARGILDAAGKHLPDLRAALMAGLAAFESVERMLSDAMPKPVLDETETQGSEGEDSFLDSTPAIETSEGIPAEAVVEVAPTTRRQPRR